MASISRVNLRCCSSPTRTSFSSAKHCASNSSLIRFFSARARLPNCDFTSLSLITRIRFPPTSGCDATSSSISSNFLVTPCSLAICSISAATDFRIHRCAAWTPCANTASISLSGICAVASTSNFSNILRVASCNFDIREPASRTGITTSSGSSSATTDPDDADDGVDGMDWAKDTVRLDDDDGGSAATTLGAEEFDVLLMFDVIDRCALLSLPVLVLVLLLFDELPLPLPTAAAAAAAVDDDDVDVAGVVVILASRPVFAATARCGAACFCS